MASNARPVVTGSTDNRAVKIDRILSRAIAAIRANPVVVLGVSFVFGGLPSVAINFLSRQWITFDLSDADQKARYFSTIGVAALVGTLFYILAQGALVRATMASDEGRKAGFADCALTGLRALVPLLGLNILLVIAFVVGFMFLLVPGIFLGVLWAAANPALVAERIGVFRAFSRSGALTKGARWKVFGVELLAVVFIWLISSVLGMVLFASKGATAFVAQGSGQLPLWYLLSSIVIQTIIVAVWGTMQTSLYIELRNWKDGPQDASLARVFA